MQDIEILWFNLVGIALNSKLPVSEQAHCGQNVYWAKQKLCLYPFQACPKRTTPKCVLKLAFLWFLWIPLVLHLCLGAGLFLGGPWGTCPSYQFTNHCFSLQPLPQRLLKTPKNSCKHSIFWALQVSFDWTRIISEISIRPFGVFPPAIKIVVAIYHWFYLKGSYGRVNLGPAHSFLKEWNQLYNFNSFLKKNKTNFIIFTRPAIIQKFKIK